MHVTNTKAISLYLTSEYVKCEHVMCKTESENDSQLQEEAEITVKWLLWALYAPKHLQICRALENKVSSTLYFYLALF